MQRQMGSRQSVAWVVAFLVATLCASAAAEPHWSDEFAPHGFAGSRTNLLTDSWLEGDEIYVCGDFSGNGDTPMFRLAKWSGSAWESIATEPPFSEPHTIAVYQGDVISNGVNPSWVPDGPWKWNGTDWEVLGEGLLGGYISLILESMVFEGDLYVTGLFQQTGLGVITPGIARWDGVSWSAVGDANVFGTGRLLEFDGDLYLGGAITVDSDSTIMCLARWDGANWVRVEALNPDTMMPETGFGMLAANEYATILSLAEHEGKLAIGGEFELIGGMPVANVVLYDPTGAEPVWEVPDPGTPPGLVRALASHQGTLYAGGDLGMVPGAAGSGTLGSVGPGGWSEVAGAPDGLITTMLVHDNKLQLGGHFSRAGSMACRGWVQYDGAMFHTRQNTAGEGLSNNVSALVPYGDGLVATGKFASAGSQESRGIASWNGSAWTAMPGVGMGESIDCTWVEGMTLHAAGKFTEIGGMPAPGLAWYDGSAWHPYPAPPDLVVREYLGIAVYDGDLFVGVYGTNLAGTELVRSVVRYDGVTWTTLLDDFFVNALEVYDGELMIGGSNYTSPSHALLAFDGVAVSPVGDAVDPDIFVGEEVHRLRALDGLLYVSSSVFLNRMGVFDGMSLQQFGPSQIEYPPYPNNGIGLGQAADICFIDGVAYLASHGDYNGYTVWSWDGVGPRWQAVDFGTAGRPTHALEFQGDLYVGGTVHAARFAESLHQIPGDPIVSSGIARYVLATSTAVAPGLLVRAGLSQNRPNPFNPRTVIAFEVPDGGAETSLVIYDVKGRVVRTLIDGFRPAGKDQVVWDGTDDGGKPVASGSYLYLLRAGGSTHARKMTLVR